jgi:hypothetical protein
VLTIGAGIARVGGVPSPYAEATATLPGSGASGTAYIYIDAAGALTVGGPGTITITCSVCVSVTATTWPPGAFRLATATFTSGAWDVSGVTELRAIFGRTVISGAGVTENAGGDYVITSGAGYSKVQNDVYFSPAGSTDGGTGVFGPIICWTTTGCSTDQLTAGNRRWVTVAFGNSGTTLSSSIYWRIPANWDGGTVSLILDWSRGSGSGANVVWSVQTVCFGSEDVTSTTYNTAQTSTAAAPSVAFRTSTTLSSLTMTGCAAGETLVVMPSRASGDAADDLAATVHLLGAVLSYKANLTN